MNKTRNLILALALLAVSAIPVKALVENQSFGIFGVAPVTSQPSGAAQAALTNSTGGSTANATLAAAALTESSGAIGGTNDADLPDLTATAATLTGSLTGTANGSLADVAAAAAATAGSAEPSAAQVDAGIATAVATIVTGVNEQNKEMQAQINALIADNVALRASIREVAAAHNTGNSNTAKTSVLVNALRTVLVNLGLCKGGA
ncbi:MAG: hypothetical protein ABMA13_22165 [Chthoniobacteraceae bacterium]